jgi:hypothetical protein
MQMAEEPSQPYFQSPQPLHYCGGKYPQINPQLIAYF